MAMFALNEVARELEVPFHVAHNDINIEELHDEFLSMLETLHTNFDEADEADLHNDLKNTVITPEHTIDSYCRCAACTAADEATRKGEARDVVKDGMIWNTTENATKQQDKDFAKLVSHKAFWTHQRALLAQSAQSAQQFWRKDFHKLQVRARSPAQESGLRVPTIRATMMLWAGAADRQAQARPHRGLDAGRAHLPGAGGQGAATDPRRLDRSVQERLDRRYRPVAAAGSQAPAAGGVAQPRPRVARRADTDRLQGPEAPAAQPPQERLLQRARGLLRPTLRARHGR